jgi:hypothetical protein
MKEERKKKAKIHYSNKNQLIRVWKQAIEYAEKKTDKYIEVLKPHEFLV